MVIIPEELGRDFMEIPVPSADLFSLFTLS
jgi:hypothetical protein